MTTLEMFRSDEDARRRWRRVPVRFQMRCRRIGRAEQEMVTDAVDLSPGGVRLRAPSRLMTGDVVLCSTDAGGVDATVALKGLVVQSRPQAGKGSCIVHVAWTNLSPEAGDELGRLLTFHDAERSATPVEPD